MARVTQLGQTNQSLAALQASLGAVQRLQEQAASGKRISKASDDPHGTSISMQLRNQQAANTQYRRNADYANNQLSTIDSTLQSIWGRFGQVRSNVIATGTTTSGESLNALAEQVEQIKGVLVNLYNTQFQGRSVFGGTSAVGAVDTAGAYVGDGNPVMVQLNDSTSVRLDIDGASIGADGFYDLLDKIAADIRAGSAVGNLADLDSMMQSVTLANGAVGATQARVTASINGLSSQDVDLTVSLAQNEDVDYAEVLTKFASQQVAYQAALGATARISQISLMDFLR